MTPAYAREGVFVDQRRPCDCMRGAIATYLGLPYELTPDISGRDDAETFWSDWAEWLQTLGLVMATFARAPGHLERWIAIVRRTHASPLHARRGRRDARPARSRRASLAGGGHRSA